MAREQGVTVDNHGIITDPGRFEGESVDILYWYDAVMTADGEEEYDDCDRLVSITFCLTDEDRRACEHACDATVAVLTTDDDGFWGLTYYAR